MQDYSPGEFKNNVLALADLAKYFKLPTILTTSFEDGPNGPLVPELKEMFPDAPYIPRPGQINAWDNEDFVKAVKETGRKQLIIAGVVTDVCVAFPALSAIEEGYEVFVVVGRIGHFQQGRPRRGPDADDPGRGADDELVRRGLRAAPRLAQRHRGPGRAVLRPHPELPQPDDQLLRAEVRRQMARIEPRRPGAACWGGGLRRPRSCRLGLTAGGQREEAPADLILRKAPDHDPGSRASREATALAVKDGRFSPVGTDARGRCACAVDGHRSRRRRRPAGRFPA